MQDTVASMSKGRWETFLFFVWCLKGIKKACFSPFLCQMKQCFPPLSILSSSCMTWLCISVIFASSFTLSQNFFVAPLSFINIFDTHPSLFCLIFCCTSFCTLFLMWYQFHFTAISSLCIPDRLVSVFSRKLLSLGYSFINFLVRPASFPISSSFFGVPYLYLNKTN